MTHLGVPSLLVDRLDIVDDVIVQHHPQHFVLKRGQKKEEGGANMMQGRNLKSGGGGAARKAVRKSGKILGDTYAADHRKRKAPPRACFRQSHVGTPRISIRM